VAPEERLPSDVAAALHRLDDLVQRFEGHPDPAVQACALELLQCVDAVHRAGLQQAFGLLTTEGLAERALGEPSVALLFELYGLVESREYLDSPPPPAIPPPGFVPLSSIKIHRRPRLAWHVALRADDVPPGAVCSVDVEGERVLVVNLDDAYYAYRHACPGTPLPLDGGQVDDGTLVCPWHGCRFDLRDGKRREGAGPDLETLPLAVEDGMVRIGLPEGAAA
jgi:nitrite reductase/ring-hydroxylating ferredoxin subunit